MGVMSNQNFRTNVESALEHGIDISGRRIFLHGDVSEDTIGTAIRGLYLLSDFDDKKLITLSVSSYGGSLDEAFALHDVTRTIHAPVSTVALGKCQSAAPLLVACGKPGERYATENTMFMLHDAKVYDVEGEHPSNLAAWAEATEVTMKRYAALLSQYTLKDKRHWTRIFAHKKDTFFTAQEALDWGLVDGIWNEKQ